MTRALVAWLTLALAMATSALARPRPARPQPRPAPAPAVSSLSVQVMHAGQMSTVSLQGDELRLDSTAAGPARTRRLVAGERLRLVAAALEALAHDPRRRSCGRGETFVSVTVDGKTGFTSLCSVVRSDDAPWRELLEVLRPLLGGS